MKLRNVKLGFPTKSGRRFDPEREEKEDGEGDEDRWAGISFKIVQKYEVGQSPVEMEKQATKGYHPIRWPRGLSIIQNRCRRRYP